MISRRTALRLGAAGLIGAGGGLALTSGMRMLRLSAADDLYLGGLAAPEGQLNVFHLGHSLVGRDMPAMLAQMAGAGHDYASQLGWGTPLRAHWYPDVAVNGFETENAHPKFRPAREALEEGGFDAVVLTEMVELTDAIKYHDSPEYLANWATLARRARPDARLYLYETWHNTDDPAGWLARMDTDFDALWLNRLALPAAVQSGAPIHIIPGGQVLAAVVRAAEGQGGIGNLTSRDALLARTPEGAVDTIHLGDLGAYLIALTHYATLYHRSPVGLPLALQRADGTAADAPDAAAGALMQEIVWDVVRATPYSGVPR
ncbi:hypothetical protein [uncultured Sulfitobacter sp.]|uniref:hypothetical protein n=1 Tax=uncultured Sulfitobacter sp. TaxID=191468 RepID=UPI0026058A32|nr:hypothetical protein [uncultured Sulfitobacter sp.]